MEVKQFQIYLSESEPLILFLSRKSCFNSPLFGQDDVAQELRLGLLSNFKYFQRAEEKLLALYGSEKTAFEKWRNRIIRQLF